MENLWEIFHAVKNPGEKVEEKNLAVFCNHCCGVDCFDNKLCEALWRQTNFMTF